MLTHQSLKLIRHRSGLSLSLRRNHSNNHKNLSQTTVKVKCSTNVKASVSVDCSLCFAMTLIRMRFVPMRAVVACQLAAEVIRKSCQPRSVSRHRYLKCLSVHTEISLTLIVFHSLHFQDVPGSVY